MKNAYVAVFAFVLVVLCVGCGRPDSSETAGKAQTNIDLAGLPKEFVYEKAKPISRNETESGGVKTLTIVMETKDSLEKVSAFYEEVETGWDQTFSQEGENGSNFLFSKGKREASVANIAKEKEVVITISLRTGP